ncbi:MAG TPA: hypothetical protein VNV85_03585 [Puia sp.]|jgi:hypothetical protein|nr:hypothetical protein [Puia sp.]
MKKIIITISTVLFAFCLIGSCKKSHISGDAKDLILGSYITLDSVINENLDFSDPTATVSIKVGSKGSPVASVNIFIATGSNALDTTSWVLVKNVPFSDGVVLSVTTADLSAALAKVSQTINPGTQYVLQNEVITKGGKYYSVSNTPSNYNSLPGYNMALSWQATAVCAFNQANSLGLYQVVTDTWVDYLPGDTIYVFAGPNANSVSFYAYPGGIRDGGTNRVPWIVNIDPATGAATVANQFVGDYPGNISTQVSATGFVFSCTGVVSLVVNVDYGGSPYAGQVFALQKQ